MAQSFGGHRQKLQEVVGDVPFDENEGGRSTSPSGATDRAPKERLLGHLGLRASRRTIVACCVVTALLAGIGVARFWQESQGFRLGRVEEPTVEDAREDVVDTSTSQAGEEGVPPDGETSELVVHVDGAVANPGLYHVSLPSPRIGDAVDLAGGLSGDADTSQINLAEPLVDGMKIHVWAEGEREGTSATPSGTAGGASSPSAVASGLVNVNMASVAELVALPGVGEVTAQAIVSDREQHGPFGSVDELTRVSGIGEKRLAQIRELVCV